MAKSKRTRASAKKAAKPAPKPAAKRRRARAATTTRARRTPAGRVQRPTAPADWIKQSRADCEHAIAELEAILQPLLDKLGIADAWRAATPRTTTSMGALNYFSATIDKAPALFANLAGANGHLFGAFLDGRLKRSHVLVDLEPEELAAVDEFPASAPTLIVDSHDYPQKARSLFERGILGTVDHAVIAVSLEANGTHVWSVTTDAATSRGSLLDLAREGVAMLLPLQRPR